MRPRDLLGVAIRAFGLWNIYQGLYDLFVLLLRNRSGALRVICSLTTTSNTSRR